MGIKVKNVHDESFLHKYIIPVEVGIDSSLTAPRAGVDLSNGFVGNYVLPVQARLAGHMWNHSSDFTASNGFIVNIKATIQQITMANLVAVWSCSQQDATNSNAMIPGMFSGADWSANRPVYKKLSGQASLSAGTVINVTISASCETGSVISGYLYFDIDDAKQK